MFGKRRFLGCIAQILLFSTMMAQSQAAQLTATEKVLLERIEALERRIAELESRVPVEANEPVATPTIPVPAEPPIEPVQEVNQPVVDSLTLVKRVEKLEAAAAESPPKSPYDLSASWKEGLRLESDDGYFKL